MDIAEKPMVAHPARQRRGSIVGPIVLIGIGLLFLAQNFGLVSGDVWWNVLRLWPLLLVAAGVEFVFGRGSWLSVLGVLFVVSIVAAVVAGTTFLDRGEWRFGDFRSGAMTPAGVERLSEDLGDVRGATVDLRHAAGRLNVVALPTDSTRLVEAELAYSENMRVDREVRRDGGRALVNIHAQSNGGFILRRDASLEDWDVKLSPKVPMDLKVSSGASGVSLDLQNLIVTRLDVDAGASGVKVVLPQAAGRTDVRINTGVSGVEVTVPEGVAARIKVQRGLSGLALDEGRFPKIGDDLYQSANYDTATNRVEMRIETGVGGVTIH